MSDFTTRPEIEGTFGVVASTHWIATAVGMGVLERGAARLSESTRLVDVPPQRARASILELVDVPPRGDDRAPTCGQPRADRA